LTGSGCGGDRSGGSGLCHFSIGFGFDIGRFLGYE